MEVKLNGKALQLNFGVRFVRELDKIAGMELTVKGVKQNFGMGLAKTVPSLKSYDAAVLSDVIYAAAWDNKSRPSRSEIDALIDNPKTDIEGLFDTVLNEMAEANAVKVAVKNLEA